MSTCAVLDYTLKQRLMTNAPGTHKNQDAKKRLTKLKNDMLNGVDMCYTLQHSASFV